MCNSLQLVDIMPNFNINYREFKFCKVNYFLAVIFHWTLPLVKRGCNDGIKFQCLLLSAEKKVHQVPNFNQRRQEQFFACKIKRLKGQSRLLPGNNLLWEQHLKASPQLIENAVNFNAACMDAIISHYSSSSLPLHDCDYFWARRIK